MPAPSRLTSSRSGGRAVRLSPTAHRGPQPSTRVVGQGGCAKDLSVEVDDQRFRARTPRFATQWLPDTPSNPHLTVVWFRLLVDAQGKPLFTLQELSTIVGSTNQQAASQHLEDFRQCGEDMRAFVLRRRKVDATVVAGVLTELLQTPLAGPTERVPRVNVQLGREDLTVTNLESALEQIPCVPVLRALRRQLVAGHVQYQEAYPLAELLESLATPAALQAGWSVPCLYRGVKLADPTRSPP
jgi:hypothetical protein